MITIVPKSDERLLALNINGELRANDYSTVEDEIKLRVQNGIDNLALVLQIQNIEGISLRSIAQDMKLATYAKHIDRIAVISASGWWEASTAVGRAVGEIIGVDVKHFEPGTESAAYEWAAANHPEPA